jgi:iron-sulfur cluster assembly protein
MDRKAVGAEYALRVGIKGTAGCAGVSYLIGFDKPQPTDLAFTLEGVPVILDKKHALYLAGVHIDWADRETERGFVFDKK